MTQNCVFFGMCLGCHRTNLNLPQMNKFWMQMKGFSQNKRFVAAFEFVQFHTPCVANGINRDFKWLNVFHFFMFVQFFLRKLYHFRKILQCNDAAAFSISPLNASNATHATNQLVGIHTVWQPLTMVNLIFH